MREKHGNSFVLFLITKRRMEEKPAVAAEMGKRGGGEQKVDVLNKYLMFQLHNSGPHFTAGRGEQKKKHLKGAHDHFFFGAPSTLSAQPGLLKSLCVCESFFGALEEFSFFFSMHTHRIQPHSHTHTLSDHSLEPLNSQWMSPAAAYSGWLVQLGEEWALGLLACRIESVNKGGPRIAQSAQSQFENIDQWKVFRLTGQYSRELFLCFLSRFSTNP